MDLVGANKIEHFRQRLAETIAWCNSRDWSANPAQGLRTDLLCPSEKANIEKTFPGYYHNYNEACEMTPQQMQQEVEQVTFKRVKLLQAQGFTAFQSEQSLAGGRILAFYPDGTVSDGGAWQATEGFFDWDSVPAWDSWIMYIPNDSMNTPQLGSSYLLSWIPAPLFEVIEEGIYFDIGQCLTWANNLDTSFIRQLKEAGLAC